MSRYDVDVVIVGAGGDGPVAAWKLGKAGLDVLVLEAGPWHGHEDWPNPHEGPGDATVSADASRLSGSLLDEQFTKRETEMAEKLLWGPADHTRGFWARKLPQDGAILQCAGVGGTTLHYTGNHPRAYPAAIDEQGHWPSSVTFEDLRPYYDEVETQAGVVPAPVTAKEQLFFQGCDEAGWDLLADKNVTTPGYRPQPNAVKGPSDKLHVDSSETTDFTYPNVEGSTLAMSFISGNPHPIDAPFEEKAKRGTNVSFVPAALRTGNVSVRPNAFVTDVKTTTQLGTPTATGVTFRDTWSDQTHDVSADTVVLAAGAIETPRLWLNSDLPRNEWVGRGLTLHFGDHVVGFWKAGELEDRLQPESKGTVDPFEGQNIAARFDYPGLGMLQTTGIGPATAATLSASQSGFSDGAYSGTDIGDTGYTYADDPSNEPWDSAGRLVGEQLKHQMSDYRRSLSVLVSTDDRPRKRNGVTVVPGIEDEHGPIPEVSYVPGPDDIKRRDELSRICARILRAAGAEHVHRSDSPPTGIHLHGTMRMAEKRTEGVVDSNCEAHDVDRLFVADHSVLPNSLGGPNPTNTGQAVAARTADQIVATYF